MFEEILSGIEKIITPANMIVVLKIAAIIVIGLLFLRLILFYVKRTMKKRFSQQSIMIVRKLLSYTALFIILILILKQLNVKLAAILGAAGIAGIAIGFASQTSLSNIISGVFLISEKAFTVGDIIKVDGISGIILSVDLLSVKIRTFDNQYVRIPNEKLINTEVVNVTKFPIRRLDINLTIAYKEDLSRVRELLLEITEKNPHCLDNPEPLFVIKEFGDHGVELLLGVWFFKTDYLVTKNTMMQEIKEHFDREGIEIPFPHLSLYAGSISDPLKIQMIGNKPENLH
ncbi:MAG: mechanosensitive ion channel family protein [Spirochaetes bacterium]|nr:mechanosensitive ion channel family protein [Spirochaetota bacterium]